MDRFSHASLLAFAEALLGAMGCPPSDAAEVTAALTRADLRGHGSHGLRLLPPYCNNIEKDRIDPYSTPSVTHHDSGEIAVATVDGNDAFGQLTGRLAADLCIEAAMETGVGVVYIRDGAHLGRIGEFAEQVTDAGLLFAGFVNGPGSSPVPPANSASQRLSTNPLAFGIPTFDALPFPIVLDMATSQVALGKIKRRAATGERLPPAWTTTPSGEPVRDPDVFLEEDGAILPLGGRSTGHKGFGLAVIAELFAGITAETPVVDERERRWGNGALFLAMDLNDRRASVAQRVAAVADHIRMATPIQDGDEILLPGEYEHRCQDRRRREGIPLPAMDQADLVELAETLDVEAEVPDDFVRDDGA